MNELSPQLQNQIAQFQQLQQQLQALLTQKYQMEAQLKEMERTLEELEKTPEGAAIYKNVGALLIKASGKDKINEDVSESKETLEIRLKAVDRQEKHMREKYQALQDQLNKALGAPQIN